MYDLYYDLFQKQRNLKLVVASATVDAEQLYNFFNQNSSHDMSKDTAVIMSVEGRLYPVDIHYVKGNIVSRHAEFMYILCASFVIVLTNSNVQNFVAVVYLHYTLKNILC